MRRIYTYKNLPHVTIRKVQTGGPGAVHYVPAPSVHGGIKMVEVNIPVITYYVIRENGRRVDSRLTLNKARRFVRHRYMGRG